MDGVELLKVYQVPNRETEDEYSLAVLQKMETFDFGEGYVYSANECLV